MSFDATARQRLATGAEEQEMPACLPLVSFLGDERATMRYETPTGIVFTFVQKAWDEAPTVTVENVPGIPGIHSYYASSFLDAAATSREFTIGANFNDQEPFDLQPHEVMAVAYMVRNQADRAKGYFQMKWVGSDPSLPF